MFWTCLVTRADLGLGGAFNLQEGVAPGVAVAVPAS